QSEPLLRTVPDCWNFAQLPAPGWIACSFFKIGRGEDSCGRNASLPDKPVLSFSDNFHLAKGVRGVFHFACLEFSPFQARSKADRVVYRPCLQLSSVRDSLRGSSRTRVFVAMVEWQVRIPKRHRLRRRVSLVDLAMASVDQRIPGHPF